MGVQPRFPAAEFLAGGKPRKKAVSLDQYLSGWTVKRCLILHALAILIYLFFYFLVAPATSVIIGGSITALLFMFFALVETKRSSLALTPLSIYFYWQTFALGFSAIYIGIQMLDGSPVKFVISFLFPKYVAAGYMIGLIGSLPMHLGLQLFRPKISQAPPLEPAHQQILKLLPKLVVFYMIGIFILGVIATNSSFGLVVASFTFSAHAAMICFILISPKNLRMTPFLHGAIVIGATLVLAAASTRANSKLYVMFALLPALYYVLQRPKLRKHLPVASLLLILVYLTVVAPTINQSRTIQSMTGQSRELSQLEAFKTYSPLYTGRIDPDFYLDQTEILINRQFEAIAIGFLVMEVEQRGFVYGTTMEHLKYAFIPRLLWAEKPYVTRGAWFTGYLGASPREAESTYSIGMEAAGELYWNFGFPGVLIGMFLLGASFAGLWRLAGADPRFLPVRMVLYVTIAFGMTNVPEFSSRIVSNVALFLIFGAIFFIFRPQRLSSVQALRRPVLERAKPF